jgi:hypothetical protein
MCSKDVSCNVVFHAFIIYLRYYQITCHIELNKGQSTIYFSRAILSLSSYLRVAYIMSVLLSCGVPHRGSKRGSPIFFRLATGQAHPPRGSSVRTSARSHRRRPRSCRFTRADCGRVQRAACVSREPRLATAAQPPSDPLLCSHYLCSRLSSTVLAGNTPLNISSKAEIISALNLSISS